jgi:NAD-dependent deacetylase
MKKVVVFTGAGISAESGIKTFRGGDGLWENHRIEDVATPHAWIADRKLVLEFYNQRRKQLLEVEPNDAHKAIASLEKYFKVDVITQNVDDLHERGGSTNVLHLHGELRKVRSTIDPSLVYSIDGWELKDGDTCEKGSQLRPHIVWFGEAVPAMEKAMMITQTADIFIVIGTSLAVYPAASLLQYAIKANEKYLIDPSAVLPYDVTDFRVIKNTAVAGVNELFKKLIDDYV